MQDLPDDRVGERGELELEVEGVSDRGGVTAGHLRECATREIGGPIEQRTPRQQREQHQQQDHDIL
ncbi:MAG: hypothetical protein ACRDZ4_03995, partial [Egibacteraceae bacterium]